MTICRPDAGANRSGALLNDRHAAKYSRQLNSAAEQRQEAVGEFVAKASSWYLERPSLWRRIADVLLRALGRVSMLRNIAPQAVLDATMRGLTKRGMARLIGPTRSVAGPRKYSLAQGNPTPRNENVKQSRGPARCTACHRVPRSRRLKMPAPPANHRRARGLRLWRQAIPERSENVRAALSAHNFASRYSHLPGPGGGILRIEFKDI